MIAGAPAPRRTPPLWLLVPLGMLLSLAAAVAAVVLSVDVNRECDTAERLVNAFDDDAQLLFQAQARLRLVLVTHPHSARAWALASRIARVSGDPGPGSGSGVTPPPFSPKVVALAHQGARKALAGEPRSWEGHVAEGWAFACERDWVMAADEARKASALAPSQPRVLELAARVARAERRPEEALRAYAAVASAPEADSSLRASAYGQLAELLGALQSFAEADSCYRRALALAPHSARVRRDFARWLTAHGRHDDAVAEADSAFALHPGASGRSARAAAHVGRGVWLIEVAHDPRRALAEFEHACADRPDDAAIWFNVAIAHFGAYRRDRSPGERGAALAAIRKAAELAPDDADIRELRGMIATEGASASR